MSPEESRRIAEYKQKMSAKTAYVDGIITRLRPNSSQDNDSKLWFIFKSGLMKMNVDELIATETLIAGRVAKLHQFF